MQKYLTDIDKIITVGDLMSNLYDSIDSKNKLAHYNSIEELIEEMPRLIKNGDLLLLKASNSMKFKKIIQYFSNYD